MNTAEFPAPSIRIEITAPRTWRFLWVKYVTGFNPAVHCARCLRGAYSRHFRYPDGYYLPELVKTATLDEQPAPWIYVCGVTPRYRWNLHIAGRAAPGQRASYRDERIAVELSDFEQVPIDPRHTPTASKPFETCRNWQFGWMAFPETPRITDLSGVLPWNE